MATLNARQLTLIAANQSRYNRLTTEAEAQIERDTRSTMTGAIIGRQGATYRIRLDSGGIVQAQALTNATATGRAIVERKLGSQRLTFRAMPR